MVSRKKRHKKRYSKKTYKKKQKNTRKRLKNRNKTRKYRVKIKYIMRGGGLSDMKTVTLTNNKEESLTIYFQYDTDAVEPWLPVTPTKQIQMLWNNAMKESTAGWNFDSFLLWLKNPENVEKHVGFKIIINPKKPSSTSSNRGSSSRLRSRMPTF